MLIKDANDDYVGCPHTRTHADIGLQGDLKSVSHGLVMSISRVKWRFL